MSTLLQTMTRSLHEPQGMLYHGGALLYALLAYVLGFVGLFSALWWVNVLAVLLLAHGMVIAAYLIHECGHNTIFRRNEHNARLGRFLNWMTGTCYGTFEDIRYKHFRHHMDNDDVVWWEYEKFFEAHPAVYKLTKFLEWFYIPAHELIMHSITVFTSFIIPQRRDQRLRNVLVILLRGSVFFVLAWFYPKVAIGYVFAYLILLHVLRLMDSTHHDYGPNPSLFEEKPPSRFGGRATEQEHTFSCPLSLRFIPLNWLVLNFGFHNAHHARPTVPWYRLPEFDHKTFGEPAQRFIPFGAQLEMYHRYRVYRVMHEGGPFDNDLAVMGADYLRACQQARNYGGNAVSFLTSF